MYSMPDLQKIFSGWTVPVRFDEPLAPLTSFRIGGPADGFASPRSLEELIPILEKAHAEGIAVFILGAGANILVSDKGFRGLVVSLSRFCDFSIEKTAVFAGAGLPISLLAEKSAQAGLAGLERFYLMPGSVGGSVWMNARCYETSVSDRLTAVKVLDENLQLSEKIVRKDQFDYKISPFQRSGEIILEARFSLEPADLQALKAMMEEIARDRLEKGHFSAPSAGSVYKNNRLFGMPTGKLIDSLGLKGSRSGGAEISPLHANIIINRDGATAGDVKKLMSFIEEQVCAKYGFALEREILFVGEE
jgi:UDP-N-acetylmuramate dehydrogenase